MQLFVQGNISFLTPFSFLLFSTNLFASISLRGCALPTEGKGNFSNVLGLPLTSSPGSPVLFCLVLFLNVQKKVSLGGSSMYDSVSSSLEPDVVCLWVL